MNTKTQNQPDKYDPKSPSDFIGPAGEVATVLKAKAARLQKENDGWLKLLLFGHPGVGKTKLAELTASNLTGETLVKGQSFHVESVNGRNVDLNLIRRWQIESRHIPIRWTVKIVNELDTAKQDAQELLLTHLDEMPARHAFIGTSNLDVGDFKSRLQTRLQQFKVEAPDTGTITKFLSRWKLHKDNIERIAVGCGGNVRAALLDAQSIFDAQAV